MNPGRVSTSILSFVPMKRLAASTRHNQQNNVKRTNAPVFLANMTLHLRRPRVLLSLGLLMQLLILLMIPSGRVDGTPVLMRVCDTREVKTVTSRVCMLYKRTKNSDVKLDKQGNLRITRHSKGEYSPAKLASDCCKIGCPPHIFANIC